jgi:hypothetical protein
VKQANLTKKRSLLTASIATMATSMALLLAGQCQGATASSVVTSVTSSAPGGFIYDGTRIWVADAQLGLCQMNPGNPGKLGNCVRPSTSSATVTAIVGQPAYDPAGFMYLPDQSTASKGIWRYPLNANGTLGVGVNIAPALGAQRPGAVAFGPDGNLYVSMTATSSIVRVNTPAAATQTVDNMATTISGLPAKDLAIVGPQLWVLDRDGVIDIVDPVGCGTKCRGAILTTILGLASPLSIIADPVNNYVYMGTPAGVIRYARLTGVTDTYSTSYTGVNALGKPTSGLMSNVTAVGLDDANNLLLVDDPTAGQVVGGATVYTVPFFIPGSNPPVQSPPDGQGAFPQPPITLLPTVFPDPIANPAALYSTGLTTPRGAVFMGTHLWVVDATLGFCKVDPTKPSPSLTACAVLPAAFVPGAPAFDPIGNLVYLADTTAGGAGILRFPFITAAGLTNETLGASTTVAKVTQLTAAAPGSSAPTSLAIGPDSQLYVAMAGSTSILRVGAPATTPKAPATHTVTSIGAMFEGGSLGLAFHNADLYDVETNDSSTIFSATLCKGTCTSLFLGVTLNAPAAVASDANFVYIGSTCGAADVPTACGGGIVWRYDPVANTITRLADTGLVNGVSTLFSIISGLAIDNLGQVTIVDQTKVWKISTVLPAVTSMSPTQAPESSSPTVTINGTNFLPSLVVTTCAAITPGNVTFVSPTQITATFAINPVGPTGACAISVATANGPSAAANFTVLIGPPAIVSVTPNTGFRGHATFPVSIVGANMGTNGVLNPIPGITFTNTVVTDKLLTTNFTISGTAALGLQNVIVTTPSGPSNALTFTIAAAPPVLTSINTISGVANTTVPITLTGTDLFGATAVNTGNPGITVTNLVVVSPTQITASLVIASTVAAGPQSITVTTPGGTSNGVTFTVKPALTSIATVPATSPTQARAGTTTTVTLTGTSLAGVTSVNAPNITATITGTTAGTVTATFTSLATAPVGPVSVSVTDVNGTSNTVTFTITGPIPVLTSINPITVGTGATVPVTITGTGLIGATLTLPAGVTLVPGTLVNNSFTTVTASLLIAGNAPLGAQLISVITPGIGNTSNSLTFTVFALAPLLNTISPTTAAAGSTVTVTLTGQGFTGTTSVNTLTGGGITVSSFTVNSGAQITATFQIALNAITQGISVTNPSGTSNALTFGIVPTLTSINPALGVAGTNVPVTLTGTSFTGATAINTGTAGITVTILTVSSTQITATFTIAVGATQGNHSISVTTPGGTTAQTVTFNVLPPAPAITSLNNTTISKASRNVGMNVNGSNLGNLPISSMQVLLNGVPVGATTVTITGFTPSQTQIRFNWTFLAAAPISDGTHAYTLNVTTPSGTSNAIPFTVTN